MELSDLLLHVADNIKNNREVVYRLYYNGKKVKAATVASIDFDLHDKYSVGPKTVLVNGVEINAGMSDKPEYRTSYYVPAPGQTDLVRQILWYDDTFDNERLRKGIVFVEKEDAIRMAEAMLCFKSLEE